jgi:hypothetical protein
MASKEEKEKQIAISERLQTRWLEHMEKLLTDGSITSTDLATLSRFLMANGWTLDVTRLPQGLKDKLTSGISPDDFSNDGDVIPIHRRQG